MTSGLTSGARVDLAVGGMTCASCAARIEKKLNRMDGVTATVNYATGTASVAYDPAQVVPEALVATVEATGYTAQLPRPQTAADDPAPASEVEVEAAALRQRVLVSALLTVPV